MCDYVNEFGRLALHRAEPSISLTMPVQPGCGESLQNRSLLTRLLDDSRREVEKRGHSWSSVGDSLTRFAWGALDDAPAGAMMLLHSSRQRHVYWLPPAVSPQASVGPRFHFRPLVRALDRPPAFYALVLDPESPALYRSSCRELTSVSEVELPRSMQEALPSVAARLFRRVAGGQRTLTERVDPARHSDHVQRQFLRTVDSALRAWLRGPTAALVLCAPPPLRELFLQRTVHRDVIIADLPLPPSCDPAVLSAHVWRPVEQRWLRQRRAMVASLPALHRAGQLRLGVRQVLPAADEGRVGSLFIARGRRCWGRYDPRRKRLRCDPQQTSNNDELLDLAAVRAATQGGHVMFVDDELLPSSAPVVALLRY